MIFYTLERLETAGPEVNFNCPGCSVASVGTSREFAETLRLFHLIPLWWSRSTYVRCRHCRMEMASHLDIEELQQYGELDVTPFISHESSFVFKFLAIAAFLLCWTPVVGLVLAIIALIGTYRVPGWPKSLAILSLPLAFVCTAVFLLLIALEF